MPMGQPTMVATSEPILILVQAVAVVLVPDAPVVKKKKVGRCWKCVVNTHATKDCKVIHYCLVCDSGAHPTIRCPILKLSRPSSFLSVAVMMSHLTFSSRTQFISLSCYLPEHLQLCCRCQGRGLSQRRIFRILWPACVLEIPRGSGRLSLMVLMLFFYWDSYS
jgi:hypothetical protein